jgi:hypothetical protein
MAGRERRRRIHNATSSRRPDLAGRTGQPAEPNGGSIMTSDSERPFIDAQTLSGTEAYVYEAIATLEYAGRPVTSGELASSTDLDEHAASEILREFAEVGLVLRTEAPGGATFELARRDWSAAPDKPSR